MYRVEMYARVRRACRVEGMSTREASRVFGSDRKTVRKMLSFSVPPGYRRSMPRRRPKLDAFTGIIDRILEDDRTSHHKQRHTAKRIFDRLRDEYGFTGGYTIVKDYVRERRLRSREMFVPLHHPAGHVAGLKSTSPSPQGRGLASRSRSAARRGRKRWMRWTTPSFEQVTIRGSVQSAKTATLIAAALGHMAAGR